MEPQQDLIKELHERFYGTEFEFKLLGNWIQGFALMKMHKIHANATFTFSKQQMIYPVWLPDPRSSFIIKTLNKQSKTPISNPGRQLLFIQYISTSHRHAWHVGLSYLSNNRISVCLRASSAIWASPDQTVQHQINCMKFQKVLSGVIDIDACLWSGEVAICPELKVTRNCQATGTGIGDWEGLGNEEWESGNGKYRVPPVPGDDRLWLHFITPVTSSGSDQRSLTL